MVCSRDRGQFVMGVQGAVIMLGYQSPSFHDALYAREVLGLRPAPELEEWPEQMGLVLSKAARPVIRSGYC